MTRSARTRVQAHKSGQGWSIATSEDGPARRCVACSFSDDVLSLLPVDTLQCARSRARSDTFRARAWKTKLARARVQARKCGQS